MGFVPDKPRFVPDKAAEPAFEREAKGLSQTTGAEIAAGSAPFRFAQGVAAPFYAAGQAVNKGMEAIGIPKAFHTELGQVRERVAPMTQAGREAIGSTGTDWAEVGGTVVNPMALAAAKAAPAASALGRVGQSAGLGGVVAGATPVDEDSKDYWTSKGGQILLGTLTGGLLSGGIEAGKWAGRTVKDLYNMAAPGGTERILTNYQRKVIGPEQVPKVVQGLRAPGPEVPGYQPTAAEKLVGTPAGSPVAAHQRITAQTPGGVSAQFGERFQQQKSALVAAAKARDEELIPMANTILGNANRQGVETTAITGKIDEMLQKPGQRASEVVQKSLEAVKAKIDKVSEQGVVNAQDLWTIRKETGNTIKTYAKETANWDKRLTAGLERDIQKTIDDAIEGAGGKGWKQFMAEYAKRSQAISATKEAAKNAYRPAQRTELGGGVNVAEETRTKMPQLLSRPMMATNFVLKKLGSGIEQRLDPEAARRYLNPEELAKALEQVPHPQRSAIMKELIQMGRVPVFGGIAAGATQ